MIRLSPAGEIFRSSLACSLRHTREHISDLSNSNLKLCLNICRFSAIGMITSMAEECGDPTTKLPKAISLCVPVGGIAGLFFIIPICATMPALEDILAAPVGQALPYIFGVVMDSPGGGLGLTFLVLVITLFCSISITVAASRCTWAFARDKALPLSRLWSKVDVRHGTPIWALTLVSSLGSKEMQEGRSSTSDIKNFKFPR